MTDRLSEEDVQAEVVAALAGATDGSNLESPVDGDSQKTPDTVSGVVAQAASLALNLDPMFDPFFRNDEPMPSSRTLWPDTSVTGVDRFTL